MMVSTPPSNEVIQASISPQEEDNMVSHFSFQVFNDALFYDFESEEIKELLDAVITLICTRHAYLASGHLRFLLCQNTTEQLFLKTPFIKAHAPCSITARVYTLADPRQPACTYKSTKKGKLLTEHTTLGKLTKPFGHAWPVIRPNT
jgi:hypothetical protein